MARILQFPTGRRFEAATLPFEPVRAGDGPADAEPDEPVSTLIALLPEPVDLDRIAGRIEKLGQRLRADEEVPALLLESTDGAPPIVLFDPGLPPLAQTDPALAGLDQVTSRRASRAKSSFAVEARLVPGRALDRFHAQLRVAAAALGDEALVWYDTSCYRWIDVERVALLASIPVRPAASELFRIHSIHARSSRDRCWLHTHGLARAGVPDLEAFGVSRKLDETAGRVMNVIAAHVLEHGLPEPGETIPVSHGVEFLLVPVDEVLPLLPKGSLGKSTRDRGEEGDHAGSRRALVDPAAPAATAHRIDALLAKADASGILFQTDAETDRMRALARHALPLLFELWRSRKHSWKFAVKLGYPTAEDPRAREHLWFDPIAMDVTHLEATLVNVPHDVPALHEGEKGAHSWSLLSDWFVYDGAHRYGPLEAHRLLGRGGRARS